ncbi:4'-phosphopantetheinyl transferase family protein [Peribacillus sp. NPDC097675]|uniref:4'-phosphopantetheinyl transferase family protein n=1 Tax=Peribacillus sp. NPDC097675 TaxID=3390618 RepID=UPI003CFDC49E
MIELYYCKLPESRESTVIDDLLFHVSKERQGRLKRFVKIDDAYRSLIGDLLVRFALKERYGSIGRELKIKTNDYGKPFLVEHPSFHYNISHSGEYVVCAVHDDAVGVDIEYIGPYDWPLAKELFTEEEYQDLLNAKDEGLATFYDIWTLKESYVKAIGEGLSKPLKDFSMKKHNNGSVQITDLHTERQIMDYICKQYKVASKYSLSVCAHHANEHQFRRQPICVTFQELCESLSCHS